MRKIDPIAVTKQELAAALRLSVRSIDNLVGRGQIPSYKIGESRRFDIEEVKAALRQNFHKPATRAEKEASEALPEA